jgi:acetoin utilization deacetylase AcuC-like enzyme
MKTFFHDDFYQEYNSDLVAAPERMEIIIDAISSITEFVTVDKPAAESDITAVHSIEHIESIKQQGLYSIAALAAGGAIQAAESGMTEPSFALIKPGGHHASRDSCWGFCYFNNMAIAMRSLLDRGKIKSAYILDIDEHYGDGNVDIFKDDNRITICNIESRSRLEYLTEIEAAIDICRDGIIGVEAGFDAHINDCGGILKTKDYYTIGQMIRDISLRNYIGVFALMEGGYNHDVLGESVRAFLQGLSYI